jgi:hypothetical protein
MIRDKGMFAAVVALGIGLVGATAFAQGNQPDRGDVGDQGRSSTGDRSQGAQGSQGAQQGAQQGMQQGSQGAMIGQVKQSSAAPVPQYWLADASLFLSAAGTAAQTISNEQSLGIQAPNVLGNQTQFMQAAINRALSSLSALQAHAEQQNPKAVPDILLASAQLQAAQAQLAQGQGGEQGSLGPQYENKLRTAFSHLAQAEKAMQNVGRQYGAQQYAVAATCTFNRGIGGHAFGAGIGGKKVAPAQPKTDQGAQPKDQGVQPKDQGTEQKGGEPAP